MNAFTDRILSHFRNHSQDIFSEVCVNGETHTVRWADLEVGCRQVIAALNTGTGSEPANDSNVVLIFLPHGLSLFPAFLGSMLGGYVPSFMPVPSAQQDATMYWKSHQTLIKRIRPTAIITTQSMVEQMRTAGLHTFDAVIVLDTDISDQTVAGSDVTGSELGFVQQPGDAVALLQHSSGTTGLKKGVALSFDAISQHAISYGKTLELSGDDVIVSWLPLYHDMGLMACFITPSFHAIKTVQMSAFDWLNRPNSLFTKIKEHEGTLCWLPNFAFEHLTNTLARHAGKFDLGSMRAFINCSEPCKASTFDRFSEAFSPASVQPDMLKNCYAMAEVVFGVSQVSMTDSVSRLSIDGRNLNIGEQVIESSNEAHATELIDCGIALEGVQIQIVDADRIPLSEGVIGEIAISSNFLFTGYNKDADRTAKSLNKGIYHSSDLGFLWNQRLYVLGRLDDLIIINGRNLFAHEIELLTGQIAGVKAGRVVALPHSDTKAGSDVLVIMAERDNNSSTSDESIINSIITRLQSELDIVPRDIKLVNPGTLVKTSSGKMSRKENYNVFIAARDTEILRRAS